MPTSLSDLKSLFVDGLDFANSRATFFAPANPKLSQFQKLAVSKASDLNQLMTAVTLVNGALLNAFEPPVPHADGSRITNFKFGEGNSEWYFIVGVFAEFAFVFCPMRVEVAPPAIVRKKFKNPADAVVWNMIGGFGFRHSQTWTKFPFNWLQGDYRSKPGHFSMALSNEEMYVNFAMIDNHVFKFTVAFGDTKLTAEVVAKGHPLPMAPNGCLNCGQYGLQSKYYSRSYCQVSANLIMADKSWLFTKGHGWIDHQSFYIGQGSSTVGNLAWNSLRVILKQRKLVWLWSYVQDFETNTQYMITTLVDPDKFATGKTYKPTCNVYRTNRVELSVKGCTLRVGPTVKDQNFDYPLEYIITLPSKKQVALKVEYGYGVVPNFTRLDSWEMPAVLYNAQGNEIGFGVVELNGVTPADVQTKRVMANLAPEAVATL
jgi:hypothetical protein